MNEETIVLANVSWGDIQVEALAKMFLNKLPFTVADLPAFRTNKTYSPYLARMPFVANEGLNIILSRGVGLVKRLTLTEEEQVDISGVNQKLYCFDVQKTTANFKAVEGVQVNGLPYNNYMIKLSKYLYLDKSIYTDNVVEVIYSNGNSNYYARVVNDDESSPLSTINRGREIIHRVTNPDLIGTPTENQISEYTIQLLRELSSLEYTISYTHAYCPVRVGDCVRLNYDKSGITNIKAKVISQSIECQPGCQVAEKAVFTAKLWNGKHATVTIKNNTTIVTGEGTGHKITVEDSVVFNYIIDHFQTTATEAGVWDYFRSTAFRLQKYFNSLQRVEAKNIELLNKLIGKMQSNLIVHKDLGDIPSKVFESLNSDIDKLYACTASYTQ